MLHCDHLGVHDTDFTICEDCNPEEPTRAVRPGSAVRVPVSDPRFNTENIAVKIINELTQKYG